MSINTNTPFYLAIIVAMLCLSFEILAEDLTMTAKPAKYLSYVRMYVDSDGVSHFADARLPMDLRDYAPPAEPIAVHVLQNVDGATLIFIPKGTFEDWHPAPRRQFAFILKGAVEVTVGDGESRQFEPGSVVLLEDTTGRGHTTRVLPDEDHLAVMVPVLDLQAP